MYLASYLCTSRHGVFYYRFPLPSEHHSNGQRRHIKVSLGTREPKLARQLSRYLTLAGQSALAQTKVAAMRYDEMREHVRQHFAELLKNFRAQTAEHGPVGGLDLDALRTTQGFTEGDGEEWASVLADGADGLLRAFCEARRIAPEPKGRERKLMIAELQKGHREYVSRALEYAAEFDALSLSHEFAAGPQPMGREVSTRVANVEVLSFDDVVQRYLQELRVGKTLAVKTASEKKDALALLADLTDGKPPAIMTKSDARSVKDAIINLPKNRSKNPQIRDLPLRDAMEVQGIERIAVRTMNVYLGHMQSLFTWAVSNGYAEENIFSGMRVKQSKNTGEAGRESYPTIALRLMFEHLTDSNSTLVKKDVHKWPALIGMFTGMRLNEIAQLEICDIVTIEDVWCINVTPDGEDHKRLKNAASRRRVPVHDTLVASGFLKFVRAQESLGHTGRLRVTSCTY